MPGWHACRLQERGTTCNLFSMGKYRYVIARPGIQKEGAPVVFGMGPRDLNPAPCITSECLRVEFNCNNCLINQTYVRQPLNLLIRPMPCKYYHLLLNALLASKRNHSNQKVWCRCRHNDPGDWYENHSWFNELPPCCRWQHCWGTALWVGDIKDYNININTLLLLLAMCHMPWVKRDTEYSL